jgi:alginate biosynthesis protein AlgX
MGKTGTLHNMAGQLCGTSYAVQYMDQFTTEPKGEAGDGDLFGDSGNPQITLVGTSHSGKNYNFAGFLEAKSAPMLNVAFPGGGLEGSMIQYLGSEEFQNPAEDPDLEFSPLYRLDQETIYRQMMALLDNGCEGKPCADERQHHPQARQERTDGQQFEQRPAQPQPPGRHPLRRPSVKTCKPPSGT